MYDEIWKTALELVWPAIIKGTLFYGLGISLGFAIGGDMEMTGALFAAVDIVRRGAGPQLSEFIPGFAFNDPSASPKGSNAVTKLPWFAYARVYFTQAMLFGLALYALPALGLTAGLATNIPRAVLLGVGSSIMTTLIGLYVPCIVKPGLACAGRI